MGKGPRRKIEVSACAWIDLLGYGSMLKDSGFDPTVELSQKAIHRLELFHQTAANHAKRSFNIFAINDGIICNMDLSLTSKRITLDFVKRVIALHNDINRVDLENSGFGARTILTTGFRVRKVNSVTVESGVKDFVLDKVEKGTLDVKEAIHMAAKARPYFGIIPELQANFAFTKAYLIDSTGSSGGFEGPNCFVDLSLFTQPMPDFISFSKYIDWSQHGLSARIGQLKNFEISKADSLDGEGFLTAKSIGEHLSKTPEVSKRIKKMTKESMKNKK